MRNTTLAVLGTFAITALASGPSHAAILFTDSFETDYAVTTLGTSPNTLNSLMNWTVDGGGSVDFIRTPSPGAPDSQYGISCRASTGCIDLDGSNMNAGRMVSRSIFSLLPGFTYTLSGYLAGNQRGGSADAIG